jgi:hypothetical protein
LFKSRRRTNFKNKAPLSNSRRPNYLDGVQSSTEWTGHGRIWLVLTSPPAGRDSRYSNNSLSRESRASPVAREALTTNDNLEKSGAEQAQAMKGCGSAPHHHQVLENKGDRSIGFVLVDRNI